MITNKDRKAIVRTVKGLSMLRLLFSNAGIFSETYSRVWRDIKFNREYNLWYMSDFFTKAACLGIGACALRLKAPQLALTLLNLRNKGLSLNTLTDSEDLQVVLKLAQDVVVQMADRA
jgi:hypothetical protein